MGNRGQLPAEARGRGAVEGADAAHPVALAHHVIAYTNGATAVQALLAGKVDCVVIDSQPAKEYVKANTGLTILSTEFTNEDYAIGVSKDNPALLAAVNTALQQLITDGTVQSIINKYIAA